MSTRKIRGTDRRNAITMTGGYQLQRNASGRGSGARYRTPLVVLTIAMTLLVGSVAAVAVAGGLTQGPVQGGHMNGGMIAGGGAPVTSIAAARGRAAQAVTNLNLHTGEVIWFDNGFYVELKDGAGQSATEVIVDPQSGAVTTEPGPAMMWNIRYGMPRGGSGMMRGSGAAWSAQAATVTADQSRSIAQQWLDTNRSGQSAQAPDAYPGYYTMETTTSGKVTGMLSVNASTGAVWYHSWHGRFLAREDS